MSLLQSAGCPRKGSRPLLLCAFLLALAVLGSSPAAWAQGGVENGGPGAATDSATTSTTVTTAPATNWSTVWAVLGGVVVGAFGAWLWARRMAKPEGAARPPANVAPEAPAIPAPKAPAQNVRKAPESQPAKPETAAPTVVAPVVPVAPGPAEAAPSPDGPAKIVSAKSLREVQGVPKPAGKSSSTNKKNKPNFNSISPAPKSSEAWPQIPQRAPAMNPNTPLVPPADNQPLEPGQTVEWAAPTSTPAAIQELIEASAPPAAPATAAAPEAAAPGNGPAHYYAPAPDVPSIEHRKLSPNPLPQMPVLITLPHAEATTAQFSFSPQADQSRIIGNGVRELKEFFQFELPPTEQFTTIQNLKPGKLEKRDDAWHVVQKAEIALS
ncbi:hypothetical protein GCM10022409_48220 [Hymenobacter glaciei]|uniref:SbsA Ig-like domain-containing protein n=1 Tax=Hymenobacter glaciei TaxID=877209 RepID=A0ABP7UY62_9BACT